MKLFGDRGTHQHKSAERKKPIRKKLLPELTAVFSAPAWKKLRKPLMIVGGVILFFLIVLLVYSIWEKPPETESDAPNQSATAKPVIQAPVEETLHPVKTEAPAEQTPAPSAPPAEPPEETVQNGRKEECYTFALLATDQMKANSDTILVGRLDTAEGTLDIVNIPRDTLVNVSWGVKKLNTVLAAERNDMDRVLEHLGNLIGYTADCYAIVDMDVVEKLVDCIGGVYYNVPRDMEYDDPSQELFIHIPQGYQLLNGENAVKVLRYRVGNDGTGYINGDLGRIATQQDFLQSMLSQFLKLQNIPNLSNAIDIFRSGVKTDMSANNLAFFAHEFLKLDRENIRFHTMPVVGISIRGGSYVEVDIDEWIKLLNNYLNPFTQEITADNLNIIRRNGNDGAVSTNGETLPLSSFYDFSQYMEKQVSAKKEG